MLTLDLPLLLAPRGLLLLLAALIASRAPKMPPTGLLPHNEVFASEFAAAEMVESEIGDTEVVAGRTADAWVSTNAGVDVDIDHSAYLRVVVS